MKRHLLAIATLPLLALTLSACGSSEPVAAPEPTASTSADPMKGLGMEMGGEHAHPQGDGTTSMVGDVALEVLSFPAAGKPGVLTLSLSKAGAPITDPVLAHTKPLHVVVVRADLAEYLHVHPTLSADGTWSTDLTFPSGGEWRIVADVLLAEGDKEVNYALGSTIKVAGSATPFTLPAPSDSVEVDGYTVNVQGGFALEHGMLIATITKDGNAVELDDYLGAKGHLVAISLEEGVYAHQHPHSDMPGMLHFMTEVPKAGTYRLFLQFSVGGKIRLATFTAEVGA